MIVTAAQGADVYALLGALGITHPREGELRSLLGGLNAGPAWALRSAAADPPLMLIGMVMGDALVFWSRSGAGAGQQLPAIVAASRQLLRTVKGITGRPVEMWIASSNRAGQVMAKFCGLRPTGRMAIGNVEIWSTGTR